MSYRLDVLDGTGIRSEFPNVLLLIGGKGPESSSLQAQIVEHGLQEHVRLLGYVPEDDLPLAYAAADVSVVPTVALEGFGLITRNRSPPGRRCWVRSWELRRRS